MRWYGVLMDIKQCESCCKNQKTLVLIYKKSVVLLL
nr:MAG TPA: hypothetical protein [Caudoviricetes sp.]